MQPFTGLTTDQRHTFEERGFLRLPALVPAKACAEMADRLWAAMARKDGVQRQAPATWTTERPMHFKALREADAFAAMGSPAVRMALDDLMGAGRWVEPVGWGQPLVCFPTGGGAWDVPHQGWHLDGPMDPGAPLVGRVFVILEPLRPRGGGTMVALGSHRLVRRLAEEAGSTLPSGEVRKRLKTAYPWFAALMSPPLPGEDRIARFLDRAEAMDGVTCQLAEMTGEPGDVWLMHPNILHGSAPNVLDAPRMALTQFVTPKD